MKLSIPPEPMKLKNQIITQKGLIESRIDTLTIWFGNRIPSYLWKESGWSKQLKKEGYNWQSFLKIFSLHKKEMIKWLKNTISWKEFLNKIEDTIKDPIFKNMTVS